MGMRLKKNDTVMVISGEHRGKTGRILQVLTDKQRALVEAVNMIKKHGKPSKKHPQGGIMEKEAAIHLSNLLPVCPKTGKATRVGIRVLDDGKRVRYSKKSKELLD